MIKRCAICDKEEDIPSAKEFFVDGYWTGEIFKEDLCRECKDSIEDALSEFYYDK